MVERDGPCLHLRRLDAGFSCPAAQHGVVLPAADHVDIEWLTGTLHLPDAIPARRAVGLDENGDPAAAGNAAASALLRKVDTLHLRVQALPGRVIGSLVGKQLLHAPCFDLNLQLGVATP